MKSLSGKDLAKILEQRGWELRRIRGSHHIYTHPEATQVRLSVPIHGSQALKIGLLRHLLKQAGISENEV